MLDGRAEAANLVTLYAALAGESRASVCARFAGQGFGAFKPALGELLVAKLAPINERFVALRGDHAALDAVLRDGAARAREMAAPTLAATYAAMGLLRH